MGTILLLYFIQKCDCLDGWGGGGVPIERHLPSYEGNRLTECDAVWLGRYNDVSEEISASAMRVELR
jgi:hypothetical protein